MTKQTRTPRLLKLPAAVAFAVVSLSGFYANQAQAQWAVIDPAHIAQDAANFIQTAAQYGKEVAQYAAVLQHYAQQLISLQSMSFSSVLSLDTTYTRIAPDAGVADACPSPKDGVAIIPGLLTLSLPKLQDSVVDSQMKVCQQIVMRRNHQYNVTVDMLNRINTVYGGYAKQFEQISQMVGTSQGALAGAQANIARGQASMDTEMRLWQVQIQSDDQIIKYLESQQAQLGQEAMKGKSTILGTIVQAGTLKLAFDELNSGN
ncbi:hypothetical protein KK141_07975 [Dyella sp. LX-66]|uniref:hypothetical protein n=1 Tax=unclassified Dyella TaxID=2634549 RepID=UPI001BE0AEBC|nr:MULTISPECIES: hypothetical protein [unclassified Dyella]MBT2115652.1 hypothetical protein [Dyella sp. LX-1]MBT2139467.1 hypothetical protein [Dyella sp. LX-66]